MSQAEASLAQKNTVLRQKNQLAHQNFGIRPILRNFGIHSEKKIVYYQVDDFAKTGNKKVYVEQNNLVRVTLGAKS